VRTQINDRENRTGSTECSTQTHRYRWIQETERTPLANDSQAYQFVPGAHFCMWTAEAGLWILRCPYH